MSSDQIMAGQGHSADTGLSFVNPPKYEAFDPVRFFDGVASGEATDGTSVLNLRKSSQQIEITAQSWPTKNTPGEPVSPSC
jgi:hypothetical protein